MGGLADVEVRLCKGGRTALLHSLGEEVRVGGPQINRVGVASFGRSGMAARSACIVTLAIFSECFIGITIEVSFLPLAQVVAETGNVLILVAS